MPEWRRALAAALIGGVSACIFTVIWGILLLFSGIEPILIPLQGAFISGMLTGVFSEIKSLGQQSLSSSRLASDQYCSFS